MANHIFISPGVLVRLFDFLYKRFNPFIILYELVLAE